MKVTFFNGATLRPVPPVASRQEDVHYFHESTRDDEPDEELLVSWVKQASALPGEDVF